MFNELTYPVSEVDNDDYVNKAFLEKIAPHKVVIVAAVVWVLLFLIAPLRVNISVDSEAYLFVFFSFVAFFMGGKLCSATKGGIKMNAVTQSYDFNRRFFRLILFLAFVGLSIKIYDLIFFRGISFNQNFVENREMKELGGGNPIGIASSFLSPFCYFPLFYYYRYKFPISRLTRIIIYAFFIGQLFDSFLLSSRSAIFINVVFLLLYLLYFRKVRLSFKVLAFIGVFFVAFLSLMSYIFLERTKVFASEDLYGTILSLSNYNFTLSASPAFQQLFKSTAETFKPLLLTYVSTLQYLLHGIFEFSYLYEHFDVSKHTYGSFTFFIFDKFLASITGREFNGLMILELTPRWGIYTSFFGPFYVDFGWFNLLFMFFGGYVVYRIYYRAMLGVNSAILLYFYMFIVLAFWPVFNFVGGAGGTYILASIVALALITRIKLYVK